ncbi:hypothetical protein [Paenibacillus sp. DR312]|uniref:hypothetical protein n=1 Tax=Paenibacillus sp. DR312 TaxID=2871175 RepID=UPI0021BBFE74|nr:hypothetical protein [Paenibacillus sp. DR312]
MGSIACKEDPVVTVTFNHTNVNPVDGQPGSIPELNTSSPSASVKTWLDTPLATAALVPRCLLEWWPAVAKYLISGAESLRPCPPKISRLFSLW